MLSGMIVAFNETWKLRRLVKQMKGLVDELVMVVDVVSPKRTKNIAKKYADILIEKALDKNFSGLVNEGLSRCSGDWILLLFPDEFIDDELFNQIVKLKPTLFTQANDSYWIPRKNFQKDKDGNILVFYNYPDYQLRLFRNYVRFQGRIHESPINFKHPTLLREGFLVHYKLDEDEAETKRRVKVQEGLMKMEKKRHQSWFKKYGT